MSENPYIKRYDDMRAAWEHQVLVRADLETKIANLHGMAIDLAHALRLAVMTESPDARFAALERWDLYVLASAESLGVHLSAAPDIAPKLVG